MNSALLTQSLALTFDDVLIVPGYSQLLPSEVDVRAKITRDIELKIPLVSAAMDTVTEARLAIALAREGGIGILHRNMSPEDQAQEVDKVKRSQSGMIVEPITLTPTATLADAEKIMSTYHISGVPVIEKNGVLVGILTNRDVRFVDKEDYHNPVTDYMTKENLVTAEVGVTLDEARKILQQHRIEKLPLISKDGVLKGLITVKDIQKARDFPYAAVDSQARLLIGAAVGVGPDVENRVSLMEEKGLDVVVIDTAHGHTKGVIQTIEMIHSHWPNLPIVAGNVVTAEGAQALIEAGASAIKVGVGAGSICTTRIVAGSGMPQLSAIYQCSQVARPHNIPVIADGGVKYSGDIAKALVAGADVVMLGSMLAGLDEAPGDVVLYEGRHFKDYRGMGSLGAMQGFGKDRYGTGQSAGKLVPEGIEGRVPYKGTLNNYVYQLVGGLRSAMGYAGAANLQDLRDNTRFIQITNAGLIESHPHDVIITKEAPNYQIRN
ncbi:MAG: IMP dehydrogenase [Anaerolineales bacterium]|nr:IMP dehydrogenase [Anaerolineales bacterium]